MPDEPGKPWWPSSWKAGHIPARVLRDSGFSCALCLRCLPRFATPCGSSLRPRSWSPASTTCSTKPRPGGTPSLHTALHRSAPRRACKVPVVEQRSGAVGRPAGSMPSSQMPPSVRTRRVSLVARSRRQGRGIRVGLVHSFSFRSEKDWSLMKPVSLHLLHIGVRRHVPRCCVSLCCYVEFDKVPLRPRKAGIN